MDFKKITLDSINPFVRFCLACSGIRHEAMVVPLEHRIICCLNGDADFWIDGQYFKVNKNDMFYISAGVPYKMVADKKNNYGIHLF